MLLDYLEQMLLQFCSEQEYKWWICFVFKSRIFPITCQIFAIFQMHEHYSTFIIFEHITIDSWGALIHFSNGCGDEYSYVLIFFFYVLWAVRMSSVMVSFTFSYFCGAIDSTYGPKWFVFVLSWEFLNNAACTLPGDSTRHFEIEICLWKLLQSPTFLKFSS